MYDKRLYSRAFKYTCVLLYMHVILLPICRSYTILSIDQFSLTLTTQLHLASIDAKLCMYVTITGVFDYFCRKILISSWINDMQICI